MIVGHGIDIVSVHRVAEQKHCGQSEKRHVERLAGRFAVKEAILKVLGTGWRGGIQWTDMEVLPNALGQPILTLTGEAAAVADKLGIARWHVSISHIETHATGSAIGESI
jgi:holo-[acyl-carrier protein] synthase